MIERRAGFSDVRPMPRNDDNPCFRPSCDRVILRESGKGHKGAQA